MELFYWLLIYPVFLIAKCLYFQEFWKVSGKEALYWSRIPLEPISYPVRFTINSRRKLYDWIIWFVAYTGMGPGAIVTDVVVWILYKIDSRRFDW